MQKSYPAISKLSGICWDPKDDKLIACAVKGKADYLVSGDKDLLDLGEYQGVQIIRSREFADLLGNPAGHKTFLDQTG